MATKLGWRVYICHTQFDFYCYTVIGARGEAEAIEIVSHIVPAGNLRLRAKLVSVDERDLPPPESPL